MKPVQGPFKPSRLDPLLQPLQAFLATESAGGIVLILCSLIALVIANSPWSESYLHFWHAKLSVSLFDQSLSISLEHLVNDGLMVIFFLLVGLEIKRELIMGELASVRRAALPISAAIGGMVVPALIFILFNIGKPGASGWGIPMATDIAFAAGVVALFGKIVPTPVKVFLLAIAIVDDLGAVLVIAFFYTGKISTGALAIAGGFLVALILLNLMRVHRPLPYLLLGIGLWAATFASGIHATIAGVLLAFTIPATRMIEEESYLDYMRKMLGRFEVDASIVPDKITESQSHALKSIEEASQAVQTTLARVEHALLFPVAFIIVPIFALANAGVDLRHGFNDAVMSPVMWGVLLGLFVGKPVGVLLASWIATTLGIAALPEGARKIHLVGVAVLCGIGFTMSLFVANLAYPVLPAEFTAAKVGILGASLVSAMLGAIILLIAGKRSARL